MAPAPFREAVMEDEAFNIIYHANGRGPAKSDRRTLGNSRYEIAAADFIEAAGKALYGEWWQRAIARDLDVSDLTIQNWSGGKCEIPTFVISIIIRILDERVNKIAKARYLGGRIIDYIPTEKI